MVVEQKFLHNHNLEGIRGSCILQVTFDLILVLGSGYLAYFYVESNSFKY